MTHDNGGTAGNPFLRASYSISMDPHSFIVFSVNILVPIVACFIPISGAVSIGLSESTEK